MTSRSALEVSTRTRTVTAAFAAVALALLIVRPGAASAQTQPEMRGCGVQPGLPALQGSGLPTAAVGKETVSAGAAVNITVYWHNFFDTPTERLTLRQVLDELAWMNRAFSGGQAGPATRFRFRLGAYENVPVPDAQINILTPQADQLKIDHHVGSRRTLNIYVAAEPNVNGFPMDGFSTYPWRLAGHLEVDGLWLRHQTMIGVPGGSPGRDGDTAVHEAGRWLGLYNVFQGYCTGIGDHVADTGQMSEQSVGDRSCAVARDTCGNDAGLDDPLHNFMAYTNDDCRNRFTPGQVQRMSEQWSQFRGN